ncbi:PRD domain-containing protein, partial [Desulfovibrio desulfuricans]|nr:PRD domain-containing protein [Desulfovibrio desulfuricans]
RMGIDFDMAMLLNVKSLYREEYKLALHAIELLRNAFHLHIDDNEANFITLHIVNAEFKSNMMQIYTITSILES